jgi:hypothetical protein
MFKIVINDYITALGGPSNILITDTILILNNLGINKVGHTQQLKKHKTMKISVIYDEFKL